MLSSINHAKLPELLKLELYLGVDNYGFNGSLEDMIQAAEGNGALAMLPLTTVYLQDVHRTDSTIARSSRGTSSEDDGTNSGVTGECL